MSAGNVNFLWQLFWPMLVDDLVYLLVTGSGKLEGGAALTASSILTGLILFPFYRKRRDKAGESPVSGGTDRSFWAGEPERARLTFGQAAVLCMTAAAVSLFFNLLFWSWIQRPVSPEGKDAEKLLRIAAGQFLAVAVAAPITEELLFRGMVFRHLRQAVSFVPAAVLSALLFGLTHENLWQMAYAFALGMVLALVCETYRGLWPAVLFHGAANLVSLGLSVVSGIRGFWPLPPVVFLFLLVLSCIGMVLGLCRIYMRLKK